MSGKTEPKRGDHVRHDGRDATVSETYSDHPEPECWDWIMIRQASREHVVRLTDLESQE